MKARHLNVETSTLRQFLEENDARMRTALVSLDDIEREFAALDSYEYISAYPRDVAELQVRERKVIEAGGVPSMAALAAFLYDVGRTANLIHAFRWTKKKAIAECLGAQKFSLTQGSLLPALALARTVLEQIGTVALLDRDIFRIERDGESLMSKDDWVIEVRNVVIPRTFGTRIDMADYLQHGLRGKRRKSYKAVEGFFNQEAKDLLNGIDVLDKAENGIRNAYEFLSEFGHPNYPSFQLGAATTEAPRHRHGFRMLRKLYAINRVPRAGVSDLRPLLRDTVELLVAALRIFLELDAKLADVQNHVGEATRSWLRATMQRSGGVLGPGDLCPCLSGRLVAACCGK